MVRRARERATNLVGQQPHLAILTGETLMITRAYGPAEH